ncbi:MAG TPA: hypothetical protein VD838_06750, partial [Anaeromyxobacteraceae bacterium]|nr:hypothetical protein [Anaeromyxobacteraceae bacterium]
KCLPLVIVHHGLGGNRLTGAHLAAQLANAGFVVAAIDAPYHGSRAFCHADTDCMTDDGETGVCTASAAHAPQGDDMGVCTVGSPRLFPIPDGNGGFLPTPSGNHFISANFFRIRDAVRQDLIDHSALVLALSRPPAPFPQPAAEPFKTALAQKGIALNGQVRYLGVSLGGIIGSSIVATNPRIDRAVLNVAGGTLVDVFTNAPAFASDVDDLFLSLGIDRHDPAHAAKYLQTLNVAKWILDPADPLNFAPHLQGETLPNLLTGQAMSAKSVLGQAAKGDQVVPNPFNFLLYGVAGIHTTLYVDATTTNNVVSHSFIGASPEPMQQVVEYLLDPTADQPSTITLNAPPPAP